ncbi:MAG: type III secretion protein [Deltaproteobacteria bacterium]|jgi:type III secretion protein F|nr:type III secretion protein [Deltaproteobacteria bacterium]
MSGTAVAGNIGQIFKDGISGIGSQSKKIEDMMSKAMNNTGGVSQEEMLNLQFQMGQYNALIESISSVTKSMTDMLKNLAQRTG